MPILNVVLSGPFSLKRLKVFAERFEDRIESVPGVLDAVIVGGLEREIHVEFDIDRVAFYGMPFSSLLSAVENSNVNVPGGSMDIGDAKYLVRVPEDFKHPDEINSIVAFVRDGKPVYLRDVAAISDSYKDPDSKSRIDGQTSVTIQVKKRSGENIIRINDAIRAIVADMEATELPPTLRVDLTSDASKDIRVMIADLENNILTGLVLVLAVVFLFIGGRSAVFVALSIPLSMLITFAVLQALGITLNMVVLFSLILALGMLVDNGIVVVENIYRHMQEGRPRAEAARVAVDEVAWPVITSTLTTVGAFFPLVFWPGIMGEFMAFLPKTVIISLFGSLFVALVINPVLSARWQTIPRSTDDNAKPGPIERSMRLTRAGYLRLLEWSLGHRGLVLVASFSLLVASLGAFGAFGRGVEFLPTTEPRRAYVRVKAPVGTNLEASDAIVRQVEAVVSRYPDIEHHIANTGESGVNDEVGTNYSQVILEFKDIHDRSRPSSEIVAELRERLAGIKGAEIRVKDEEMGPPTGEAINLEISGADMAVLGELVEKVRRLLRDVPGLVDVKDNFVKAKPEITVRVDKEKAALLGLDTNTVAQTVKSAINGAKVGTYREGKDEYDIIARLPDKDRTSVESVRRLTVSGPDGRPVPLTSVASVTVGRGLGGINRIDQKRVVTISGDAQGRLPGEIIKDIQTRLRSFAWPRGYHHSFTGKNEEQDKAMAFLSKAFTACIFIIFLVLVTQFNAFSTPFIILTSVLLSFIGVFAGLLATDMPFGVIMTGVGVVSLAGVVVNNAIVLIDYFEQLVREGLAPRAALIQAGLTRFRPVLLTAVTTILGLVPMATGVSFDFLNLRWDIGGESSQWWGSMAVAVIFGLAVATVLTLVVVPVLCSVRESVAARRSARKAARKAARAAKAATADQGE
jgi:multidrug efflux pump subunit AcrB